MQSLLNNMNETAAKIAKLFTLVCVAVLTGCASAPDGELPSAQFVTSNEGPGPQYVVGPLDTLEIFVWRQVDLSRAVTVRPDGRFSMPLIDDIAATGKTPTQLARDIEEQLVNYVQSPIVTVIVGGFTGPFAQQVRVVGAAAAPAAIPYRANMTLLDAMISVGGLTEFAAGNSSTLARVENGVQREYRVRLNDLLRDGDVSANVKIEPGDVIIVPESFF